ncbi:HET-domain-containing protein, partial [Coniochaeta sp. PMI_546]
MDTDIYSPIDVRNGEIRLLLLAPGGPHEQISGVLIHTKVNDRRQKYEALSYTWGSSEFKTPITINGCPCLVNINLLAALLELRSDGEERLLWIDAICINQDDVVEKGVHVPLMHHVYQNASRVIVWLGCASDDSDQAL